MSRQDFRESENNKEPRKEPIGTGSMTILLTYLFVALVVSFICSILESVVLSIPLTYITIKIEEGSPYSKDLVRLRDNIDQPISAILTLNTFAHTLGAAGVGAQAQILWGQAYLSLISAALTLLILIFSEIIPKTLGASYWKELTPTSLRAIRFLIFILYPLVKISQLITQSLKKKKVGSIFTRSDIRKLAEVIQREGYLEEQESMIIRNLMIFKKIMVREIMTPRIVLVVRDENTTVDEFYQEIDKIPFSRIPIYQTSIDTVTGFVLKDDVLKVVADDESGLRLSDISRKIHIISGEMTALSAMEELIRTKAHISLVVDSYGGTEGVLTIEDLVEELLGLEIVDETDTVRDLRSMARRQWTEKLERYRLKPRESSRQESTEKKEAEPAVKETGE